ncbi:hypothetical protein Tco_0530256 [Tanacetum coccineum]
MAAWFKRASTRCLDPGSYSSGISFCFLRNLDTKSNGELSEEGIFDVNICLLTAVFGNPKDDGIVRARETVGLSVVQNKWDTSALNARDLDTMPGIQEAKAGYMAKIRRFSPARSSSTGQPLEMYKNLMKKMCLPIFCPNGEEDSGTLKMRVESKIDKGQKIVQLILFIVDYGCTKHMTGNLKLLCNFVEKFLGTVHFGNDQFALILGYRDLIQGNVTIKWVYYVEGLNHNLFSVGQLCDADLEDIQRYTWIFFYDQGWKNQVVLQRLISTMFQRNLQAIVMHCLIPQGQKASDYDNSDPVPPRQNVVPSAGKTDFVTKGVSTFSSVLYLKNITIQHTIKMRITTIIKHRMHHFKKLNLSIPFVHGYKKLSMIPMEPEISLEQVRGNQPCQFKQVDSLPQILKILYVRTPGEVKIQTVNSQQSLNCLLKVYAQEEGIDLKNHLFSPVLAWKAVRIFCCPMQHTTSFHSISLMEVKNGFLNGPLKEVGIKAAPEP